MELTEKELNKLKEAITAADDKLDETGYPYQTPVRVLLTEAMRILEKK